MTSREYSDASVSIRSRSSFRAASSFLRSTRTPDRFPDRKNPLRLRSRGAEPLAQIGEPRRRGEQQMAQIALAGENAFAAGLQRLVVETEHRLVRVAIETSEFSEQHGVGNGIAGIVQQAVVRQLEPGKATDGPEDLEFGFDPHCRIRVQKVEPALMVDAVKQVHARRHAVDLPASLGP